MGKYDLCIKADNVEAQEFAMLDDYGNITDHTLGYFFILKN